jgi:DNA repair exonuclease SbcCD ATPase subunit
LKPYGKKIGRGLKGSRFLDNGCPCCGREHDHKGATRQALNKEIVDILKEQIKAEEEERLKSRLEAMEFSRRLRF